MSIGARTRSVVILALAVLVWATSCSDTGGDGGAAERDADGSEPTTDDDAQPGYVSDIYADAAHWVCRPDSDDVCDAGLDATVVAADGTLTVERFEPADDPAVDCFYVYPTISRDPGANSDLDASDDEEGYAALHQVARLGSQCRVFAPTYRQVTLGSLASRLTGGGGAATEPDTDLAYSDVADAWRHYLANDNDGRGVVLIGHSQGSGMLTRLIRDEIDPDDQTRGLLVSAFLAGSTLEVPEGEDVGGAFEHVPLCRRVDQTGCALSWASFRDTAPPPATTFFGRVRDGGAGVAACNIPADPSGEAGRVPLKAYFPASPTASILADLGAVTDDGASWTTAGAITTPFVAVPGLVEGQCTSRDGTNYLEVHVAADPEDPRADDIGGDLTPEWGLHLVDVSLVMGDIVELVARQTDAYLNGDDNSR